MPSTWLITEVVSVRLFHCEVTVFPVSFCTLCSPYLSSGDYISLRWTIHINYLELFWMEILSSFLFIYLSNYLFKLVFIHAYLFYILDYIQFHFTDFVAQMVLALLIGNAFICLLLSFHIFSLSLSLSLSLSISLSLFICICVRVLLYFQGLKHFSGSSCIFPASAF